MPSLKKSLPVLGGAPGQRARPPAQSLWRSLQERLRGGVDRGEASAEFPAGATDADAPVEPRTADGTSRRGFMQLLGGSMALAGLTACVRRPKEQALPYTRQPESVIPGKPLHYATLSALGGTATGLLVTAYDGRPTKIEGNPDHPESQGATGLLHQASILSLYDPARADVPKFRGNPHSWKAFLEAQVKRVAELKAKDQGASVRFLMEPTTSPLLAHLRGRVQALLPRARFQSWSSLSHDNALEGARLAFGQPLDTRVDLSGARVIVSLDADFLASLPGTLRHQRAFASGRDPKAGEMNRLYQVETRLSVTGASADHRLPVRGSEVQRVAAAILGSVAKVRGGESSRFASLAVPLSPEQRRFVDGLAKDLMRNAGRSAVVVGPRQPAAVHAIAHALNAALGNKAVTVAKSVFLDEAQGTHALAQLSDDMHKGLVDTLVITARNPAYTAPADLELSRALLSVANTIYLSPYEDETAKSCAWFIPAAHELEAWGDGRAADGTVSFQQPLISPLFNGQTEADVLLALLGEGEKGTYAVLRELWKEKEPAAFDEGWDRWISSGMLPKSATPALAVTPRWDAIAGPVRAAAIGPAPGPGELEADFAVDYKVFDGRFANNAWMQEMPDPITRLAWDNAALIAPATANRLGLAKDDVVELTLRGRTVRAPVYIQPGQAVDAITLPEGYGRTGPAEALAIGVGFNANAIRAADGYFFDRGLVLKKAANPSKHHLVETQEHHTMDGRFIAASLTLEEFEKDGKEILDEQRGTLLTLHPAKEYDGFKWAMAVDLGKCTGCNACVIACQSENNIPIVGKENVDKSREMHWLRIDRYYKGETGNPEVVHQPMLCQHCEDAPCEYVCPVNATVHDDEGLNVMVYNRCVGTRYCSNNCPYKVRRFNFFNYTADYSNVERMSQNPDVTVRARGVMEKCTFCVQRIERVRIDSRVAGQVIKDGDIVTACAQACPSRAIVFGSIHDPGWTVAKLHQDARRYDVLHELGTRPRTAYLARVKNPNPELA